MYFYRFGILRCLSSQFQLNKLIVVNIIRFVCYILIADNRSNTGCAQFAKKHFVFRNFGAVGLRLKHSHRIAYHTLMIAFVCRLQQIRQYAFYFCRLSKGEFLCISFAHLVQCHEYGILAVFILVLVCSVQTQQLCFQFVESIIVFFWYIKFFETFRHIFKGKQTFTIRMVHTTFNVYDVQSDRELSLILIIIRTPKSIKQTKVS